MVAGRSTYEAAGSIDPDMVFGLLAGLVARSLVVAEEHGPLTRYRLLETIRQYGQERLEAAGQAGRWRACHAGYYAGLLPRVRGHAHDDREEVFWAVRAGPAARLGGRGWAGRPGDPEVSLILARGADQAPVLGADLPTMAFALLDGVLAVSGTLWFTAWLRGRWPTHGPLLGKAALTRAAHSPPRLS